MKLFITGGTGFLGQAVVRALLEAGHTVHAMVRDPRTRYLPEGAQKVEVSFDDAEGLVAALTGMDAIYHLAGKVSRAPEDSPAMYAIHVEATQKLLAAAEKAKVRKFILASTSGTIAVSEEARGAATEEDDAPLEVVGKWPYYSSKRMQEQEVLRWDADDRIEAVVLNPSLLLGPGDERLSSTTDVLNVLNKRIPAITDGTAAIVDVRDCAPAFVAALTKGRRGQRYLLNGSNMKVRSFIERVANAGDIMPPRFSLSKKWALAGARFMEGLYKAGDRISPVDAVSVDISAHFWDCDASLAKKELDFMPRDPQKTIQDTVRFLEQKGLFRRT